MDLVVHHEVPMSSMIGKSSVKRRGHPKVGSASIVPIMEILSNVHPDDFLSVCNKCNLQQTGSNDAAKSFRKSIVLGVELIKRQSEIQ